MNRYTLPSDIIAPANSNKPIELYVFVDPLCQNCWEFQSVIKKLQIDYEQYFTLRVILRTKLRVIQPTQPNSNDLTEDDFIHPLLPSIAVKAAEFQGKKAGKRFLTKLQENLFLESKNVTTFSVLLDVAEKSKLDVDEFVQDLDSDDVKRAFQGDLYISREMEVDVVPSIVFFNERIEDEGLKVSGLYSYEVYEKVLEELVGCELERKQPPELDELLSRYDTLATQEIAAIYEISEQTAERLLKIKLLQQNVECQAFPNTKLWSTKKFQSK